MDKGLFIKSYMICLVYVDDKIIDGTNAKAIELEMKGLGIRQDKQRHAFELRDEGEVGYFLGIRTEQQKDLKHDKLPQLKLYQPGLTDKFLNESHLAD